MPEKINHDLVTVTGQIVAAYVGNHNVTPAQLHELIQQTYKTLSTVHTTAPKSPLNKAAKQPITPAVPVKKSIHPDYLICLEDGKKLKMLKRYLRSRYDMSPEEYKERWNLPATYPMVAPNYSVKRADVAKQIGLGQNSRGRPRK